MERAAAAAPGPRALRACAASAPAPRSNLEAIAPSTAAALPRRTPGTSGASGEGSFPGASAFRFRSAPRPPPHVTVPGGPSRLRVRRAARPLRGRVGGAWCRSRPAFRPVGFALHDSGMWDSSFSDRGTPWNGAAILAFLCVVPDIALGKRGGCREKSPSLRLSKDLLDPKRLKCRSGLPKAPVLALTLVYCDAGSGGVGAIANLLRWPSRRDLERDLPAALAGVGLLSQRC